MAVICSGIAMCCPFISPASCLIVKMYSKIAQCDLVAKKYVACLKGKIFISLVIVIMYIPDICRVVELCKECEGVSGLYHTLWCTLDHHMALLFSYLHLWPSLILSLFFFLFKSHSRTQTPFCHMPKNHNVSSPHISHLMSDYENVF